MCSSDLALLMNLWGRKCSPRPTPPPSWLLLSIYDLEPNSLYSPREVGQRLVLTLLFLQCDLGKISVKDEQEMCICFLM